MASDDDSEYKFCVFPTADIQLRPELPPAAEFWTPEPGEVDEYEGFGLFQDVWAIVGVSRGDAMRVVEQDKLLAKVVGGIARDPVEFDLLAAAVETGSTDEIDETDTAHLRALAPYLTGRVALENLELGVAGLVYALSAAGMYPAASCRGHPGPNQWSPFPVVMFAADRLRAEVLQPLVADNGCGFTIDRTRDDLLVVNSASIRDTLRLSGAVLGALDVFQAPP